VTPASMGDGSRMGYFVMLSRDEQEQAIRRLANSGMSVDTIASATQLSREMIRTIIGPPTPEPK
jgi:hypothetical protein